MKKLIWTWTQPLSFGVVTCGLPHRPPPAPSTTSPYFIQRAISTHSCVEKQQHWFACYENASSPMFFTFDFLSSLNCKSSVNMGGIFFCCFANAEPFFPWVSAEESKDDVLKEESSPWQTEFTPQTAMLLMISLAQSGIFIHFSIKIPTFTITSVQTRHVEVTQKIEKNVRITKFFCVLMSCLK